MSNNVGGMALSAGSELGTQRSSFFFLAHVALLAVVLIGFAPSFFLRAFFDVPPMPASLYLHGVVMAIWFAFGPVQGWLMAQGRQRSHRRLGYVAAAYASIFVVFGLLATARMAARVESPESPTSILVWGNYFTLLVFAGCVCVGIALRRKPEAHKRLMLLASVSVVGPALGRFPLWPVFAGGVDAGRDFAIGGLIAIVVSLIAYDVAVQRRPHPATWIGALAIFCSIAAAVALGVSQTGFEILQATFGKA
jgi:hypothetical protein